MASICGVCQEKPSKYKCSKCSLPYCSLVCYKPHKETHDNHVPTADPSPSFLIPAQPENAAPTPLPPPRPKPIGAAKKHDFSALATDPDLQRLMSRYPSLRIQLQHIYSFTLEPDPQDQRGSFDRGRGRGRGRGVGRGGRGAWRGSRGGYGGAGVQKSASQWNQARGDKDAFEAFRRMKDKEGSDEGLGEFVRLVAMKFGSDAEVEQGQAGDTGHMVG